MSGYSDSDSSSSTSSSFESGDEEKTDARLIEGYT